MLYVSVLGEQSITDDTTGAVVTRSPRGTTLVAFLALHAGVPQPRQLIAPLFWPDSTTAQALTNLRRELHHLRRALDDDPAVEVTPPTAVPAGPTTAATPVPVSPSRQ